MVATVLVLVISGNRISRRLRSLGFLSLFFIDLSLEDEGNSAQMLDRCNGHANAQTSCRRREDDGSKDRHWKISSVAGETVGMSRIVRCIVYCVDIRKACEPDDEDAENNGEESLNYRTRRNCRDLREGRLLQHVSHPELLEDTALDSRGI